MPPDNSKVRRWIDLIATLLGAQRPLTFYEIAAKAPAYMVNGAPPTTKAESKSTKRTFERDKDELRDLGVPIESLSESGEEGFLYSLRVSDFYLPYLGIVSERGIKLPDKVARRGYQSVQSLAFDSDELQVIAAGAARVLHIGDAELAATARTAVRKLAFDLPLGATDGRTDDVLVPPRGRADTRMLSKLGDALFNRKRVTCQYHGMAAAVATERTLEAYGLFYVSGHWYLCARDIAKDALRNFRVSRVVKARVNVTAPGTPDYDIPGDFSLRAHAQSRQAWEIGDVDSLDATVAFVGETGATIAARALGDADARDSSRRHFAICRTDSFARWLLAFAGEAVPISPESLVHEYAQLVRDTLALYSSDSPSERSHA